MYEYRFQHAADRSDQGLRVGDHEREQTGDRLRRAHAEGRLDAEEFQERIERCYKAKTAGELSGLVADLPGDQRQRERPALPLLWLIPRWRVVLLVVFTIVLVSAVIHGHVLWALLPLLFLSRLLLWRRRPYFGYSGLPRNHGGGI